MTINQLRIFNSVGGAAFFERLLADFEAAGCAVQHHQAVTQVEYRLARGLLSRLRLRWKMYGGFAWSSWCVVRRSQASGGLRLVTTNPFFLPALLARAAGGRGATINLLYDLYPEALIHAGKISSGSWLANRCAAITRYALRECAATVFLGEHLRAYVEATYGPARRAVIIPVGADGSFFKDHPPLALGPGDKPRILYCGQMGRMHDVETLVAAWQSEEAAKLDWAFHASGAGYARLRAASDGPSTISWGRGLPDAEWAEAMKQAQVALVTIAPGAERVVMPSKTYSALVAGQAVLAICPSQSDLADLVRKHDCGWVVEPGDVDGLRAVLHAVASDPVKLQAMRERAFEAGHRFYDSAVVAKEWMTLFAQLTAGRGE